MCGIAGAVNLRRDAPRRDLSEAVIRMRDTMPHRGPDAAGFWSQEDTVFLAHRRLSIVDLSDHGRQPMSYAAGRYTITFNGEIYNFRELAKELTQLGHQLSSTGDTQVLLAAIAQWGLESALERLVGMFAFAAWDAEGQVLHLARDRLGEKPLHFCEVDGILYFASELRAFHEIEKLGKRLSPRAVTGYLQFGYVPEPYSMFEGVYKLPPGTTLSVPARRGQHLNTDWIGAELGEGLAGVYPRAYWSCEAKARAMRTNSILDADEAAREFEALLRTSIRNQMLCDVPLGCFLSGGIDSSLVAAIMQSESITPIHTFTVRFDTPGFDESTAAKRISDYLGTKHEEFLLAEKDVVESIPSVVPALDEPTANGSVFAVRQISRLAKTRATVVLSGDGGDELFAGYNRYQLSRKVWNLTRPAPVAVRRMLSRGLNWISEVGGGDIFLRMFPFGGQASSRQLIEKLHRIARARNFGDCYDYVTSCWPRYLLGANGGTRSRRWTDLPKLEAMLLSDQVDYLPGDSLAKVDRASMAASLETRLPLLDHRLVEFSWRVASSMKIRDGQGKWLMRQVLTRLLPPRLTDRPKMGFSVPIESWMQASLRPWVEDQFHSDELMSAISSSIGSESEVASLLPGKLDRCTAYQRWSLAVLAAWIRGVRAAPASGEGAM